MPSYRDLLKQAKDSVRQVDGAEGRRGRQQPGAVVLDVREPEEYEQGAAERSHIPRGNLESHIESRVTDKDTLIVYCAAGNRSAFAARTLEELGYSDVVSVAGGFNRWKDEAGTGRPPGAHPRAAQPVLPPRCPEIGEEGQLKLLGSRVLLSAPAASAPRPACTSRRPASALSVWSTWTSSTSRTSSGRSSTTPIASGRKVDSAKKTLTALNPDVNVVTHDVRLGADNVVDILGLRRRGRRGGQLPRAVPTQRRLAEDRRARRPRLDLPVRGPGPVFKPYEGPCYRCATPSRRRPSWRPPAPRPACWACCPGSSAPSRRWRR